MTTDMGTGATAEGPFGWRGARRPTPWMSHAVAAGGGFIVAVGVIVLGFDSAPDEPGVFWTGLLLCVALGAAAMFAAGRLAPAVDSAATAAFAVAVPGAAAFLILFRENIDFNDSRPFFLLSIAAWSIAFFVGPLRGRTLLLGLALLLVWFWIMAEVAESESLTGPINDAPLIVEPGSDFDEFESSGGNDDAGTLGIVSLVFGLGYLGALFQFDRRGERGVATAFVLPGVLALTYAVSALGSEADSLAVAGLLSIAAGLFAGYVGSRTERRFTVWTGAFLATVGVLLLSGDTSGLDDPGFDFANDLMSVALLTIAFGAAVVAASLPLGRAFGEPCGGDGPDGPSRPPRSPAPTGFSGGPGATPSGSAQYDPTGAPGGPPGLGIPARPPTPAPPGPTPGAPPAPPAPPAAPGAPPPPPWARPGGPSAPPTPPPTAPPPGYRPGEGGRSDDAPEPGASG